MLSFAANTKNVLELYRYINNTRNRADY